MFKKKRVSLIAIEVAGARQVHRWHRTALREARGLGTRADMRDDSCADACAGACAGARADVGADLCVDTRVRRRVRGRTRVDTCA